MVEAVRARLGEQRGVEGQGWGGRGWVEARLGGQVVLGDRAGCREGLVRVR